MKIKIGILFFILFHILGVAQKDPNIKKDTIIKYDNQSTIELLKLNSEKLKQYKTNRDFDYSENNEEDHAWTKFTTWLGNLWDEFWDWVFGSSKNNTFVTIFLKLLPYLIIIGVIAFIIWLFYKLNPGATLFQSSEKGSVFFSEEEEIIKRKDIKKLINKAIKEKNYRLAIRYYYLLLLKNLSEANLIEYEFDKTNNDYIQEIKKETLSNHFIKATTLYDYIWYGNFPVSETEFNTAKHVFIHLEKQITTIND
ncbi:MAG: DUF4129 domain-containing protein [Flavobacteriales bacterium]